MKAPLTPGRQKAAWILAVLVDAAQIGITASGPLGWLVEVPLDFITMGIFWWMLGWNWAFLPTVLIEWIPFVDVAPTWTLAVWWATRGRSPVGGADTVQPPKDVTPKGPSSLPG